MINNHTWVICAYKESEYLPECIESLKKQTVNSNIIMITSTPNDYIEKLAKKNNIPLYINDGKTGIGEDWNYGVSKSETKYVTIAHQDDVYESNYLEEIEKYLKNRDFIIAFTDYREIKNGNVIELTNNLRIKKLLLKPIKLSNKSKLFRRIALAFGCAICCPSVTLNTEIVGKNPYNTDMKCDLDWNTWTELSKEKGNFAYINKELMRHRIHADSETTNLIENNVRMNEDYEMFCKFWIKPIAKILMKKYKKSIATNQI